VLDGTVVRFESRNPHAYLHIEVIGDDGEPQIWVCESHGVTMLERNGVTRDLLSPGTTYDGDPAPRRAVTRWAASSARWSSPTGAYSASTGPLRQRTVAAVTEPPAAEPDAAAADAIFGTWLLRPRAGGGGGQQDPMIERLTEAGRRASDAYDPYTDDPVLRCDTIGVRRVWFAVGTPLADQLVTAIAYISVPSGWTPNAPFTWMSRSSPSPWRPARWAIRQAASMVTRW
jgi:hypothetical protein